jgi:hypothetical protein
MKSLWVVFASMLEKLLRQEAEASLKAGFGAAIC